MKLTQFDHVNVLTTRRAELARWYDEVLGLTEGPRPDFDVGGAWLYLGDAPLVHLVDAHRQPEGHGPIEHFAFRAEGLAAWRAHFADHGIKVVEAEVPGTNVLQLNIRDPDGNHIHVDFAGEH
jgi:catechol-2,3-dioxygenase